MSLQSTLEELRKKYFPMELPGGLTAHSVQPADLLSVATELWGQVFGLEDESRGCFQTPESRKPIAERLNMHYVMFTHHECIRVIAANGQDVGWFVGNAEEPLTFYLRNGGVTPDARGQGAMRTFLPRFLSYLRELGYERVTSQHHPNNAPVLIAMLKNGFFLEGMNLDERYGPLVKMVGYLYPDRKKGFEDTFRLGSYAAPTSASGKEPTR
jgi:GNAT superfamily N-acetyltransferase